MALLLTVAASTGCASTASQMNAKKTGPSAHQLRLASMNFEDLCIGYIAPDERPKTPGEILNVKPINGVITSKYGPRKLKSAKKAKLHKGIDLSAKRGTEVKASGEGEVLFSGRRNGYGKVVEIDHGEGLMTRYAHLDNYKVKVGQTISAGTPIGTLGQTGRTTGPNLHFEVLIEDKPVNPDEVLAWINDQNT
ncbi:M23 family metallopeptidase [Deltaproteobacteria bacterium OttesenSCG-928-M10]|nr:M23 family metallopeptidase [Deltaproteobacteria bacterium OttesenSCG-928-M10]